MYQQTMNAGQPLLAQPANIQYGKGGACNYCDLNICGWFCCVFTTSLYGIGLLAPCFPTLRRQYVNGKRLPDESCSPEVCVICEVC